MAQLKNTNRFSWASGANLCQVKVFQSEDCPSKMGLQIQSCPPVKPSQRYHAMGVLKGELSLLKHMHGMESFRQKPAQISQIKWQCPPKFSLDDDWHVAAVEESREIEIEKHREMSVFEAVYRCVCAIPPSPFMPSNSEDCQCDDSHIPLIPLTPIEDGYTAADLPDMVTPVIPCTSSQELDLPQDLSSNNLIAPRCDTPFSLNLLANKKSTSGVLPALQGDMLAAPSVAITAMMEGDMQGSLIDTDLLIKLLSNPELVERLINEPGGAANSRSEHFYGIKPGTPSCPLPGMKADQVIKKSINETSAPANNMPKPIFNSMPADPSNPYISMAGSMPKVLTKMNNELGVVEKESAISHPVPEPMERLVPMSSKPGMAARSVNEHIAPFNADIPHNEHSAHPNAHISHVASHVAGSKLVTLPPPLPNSLPDMLKIKRLINEYGAQDNNGIPLVCVPKQMSPSVTISSPLHGVCVLPRIDDQRKLPISCHMKPFSSNSFPASPLPVIPSPKLKDISYCKSLTKHHGEGQNGENLKISESGKPHNYLGVSELILNRKPTEQKQNHQKVCMYFNTVKGCRNGLNCPYRHDNSNRLTTGGVLEAPSSKRVKLGY